MADQKISDRDTAGPLTGDEVIGCIQSGVDFKTTTQGIADLAVKTVRISISSAQILDLNSSPVQLIAAQGSNTAIIPVSAIYYFQGGATPYATTTNLTLNCGGNLVTTSSGILNNTANIIEKLSPAFVNTNATMIDTDLNLFALSANPSAGDGTLQVYVTYIIINI